MPYNYVAQCFLTWIPSECSARKHIDQCIVEIRKRGVSSAELAEGLADAQNVATGALRRELMRLGRTGR